jgi:hypothetical protein
MTLLALALWPLGEVDQAISLIDRMQTRMADLTHVGTLALGRMQAAMFELMRGDHTRARTNVSELARIVRDHDLPLLRAFGEFLGGWATANAGSSADGLESMRRGVDSLRAQNILTLDGLLKSRWPRPRPGKAIPTALSPSSTKRWRRATAWAIAHSKPNCIGCAGKSC